MLAKRLVGSRPTKSEGRTDWILDTKSGRHTSWATEGAAKLEDLRRQERKVKNDPPNWPGWEHYRPLQQTVRRNRTTDIPVAPKSEHLLKKPDWSVQIKFTHQQRHLAKLWSGMDEMLHIKNGLSGEREGLRRAARQTMFELKRRSDDSLNLFVLQT